MQIPDGKALIQDIGHNLVGRQKLGIQLLLVFIVRSNGGQEGARRDVILADEVSSCGSAGNAHLAVPYRAARIINNFDLDSGQFARKVSRKSLRLSGVEVECMDNLQGE